MDLGIEGRVALVGGASQGIGRAVAEVLIAEGARVVITARDEARTAAVAAEIGAAAGYGWDSGDLDGAATLVARVREHVGEIDILVTNTGGPPTGPDPLAFSDAQWEQAHRSLVMAPLDARAAGGAGDARTPLGPDRRDRLDLGARADRRADAVQRRTVGDARGVQDTGAAVGG